MQTYINTTKTNLFGKTFWQSVVGLELAFKVQHNINA